MNSTTARGAERKLYSVEGNRQRLDGGAMFGNVPRALWRQWISPDEENRIPLACRAMLVREADRTILFETGIGAFFEPRLRERYGVVEERHVLLDSLAALGVSEADIDVVVLSHLHFDHAGGLLKSWAPEQPHELLFSNAQFVTSKAAFVRASSPHPRDRASYIPALTGLLEASGRLRLVTSPADAQAVLGNGYRFHVSEGHTPGLLLTEVSLADGPVVFAGDLVPGVPWVHLPVSMGYDRYPEQLIDEKEALYASLAPRGGRLFFAHDADTAVGRLTQDGKGRWSVIDRQSAPLVLDR